MLPVILASGSIARRQLLDRLQTPYLCDAPDIDETPRPDEPPKAIAGRLAKEKAHALASKYPDHLIIGSDQVADLEGIALGKPGNHTNAVAQLRQCSGKTLKFHTGLCLLNSKTGQYQHSVELYTVRFRPLSERQIEQYLLADQPYQCAGSFKAESLGIALFNSMSGDDPNTLIGLPLIRLIDFLNAEGVQIPSQSTADQQIDR